MLKTDHNLLFSICTLVTRWDEYAIMKTSFEACGFTDECEYIVADNSKANEQDAYMAIRKFLNDAAGKYVIIVHQDVRCIDSKEQLKDILKKLSEKDSKWAVCGNAGSQGYHQEILYIDTVGALECSANLPCKVISLDENLLIFNAEKRLTISDDIGGFHFYGTDVCTISDFLGYSNYVIPFLVTHLSDGNIKDMMKYRQGFIDKYAKKLEGRYIQTTCTKFYLSNSLLKNKLYNSAVIFFFIKAWQRLKYNWKLITKGKQHKKTRTPH